MYVVAFAITYALVQVQVRRGEVSLTRDEVDSWFFRAIILLLVGARVVSQLIYEGSWYYWTHPWLIFWPFRNGRFVGLAGMSYHGGLAGAILGTVWFSRSSRRDFFTCADTACAGIPLGYTFGRLGNFLNGELWGRVSAAPWAMVFPDAPPFPADLPWVREVMERTGVAASAGMVNLPRHPSQLYEALFEGLVLFLFLWFVIRPRRSRHASGWVLGWYLIGYGAARFCIEYFREPDANLGFLIKLGAGGDTPWVFTSFANISLGQIFCAGMILSGVVLLAVRERQRRNKA